MHFERSVDDESKRTNKKFWIAEVEKVREIETEREPLESVPFIYARRELKQ